MFIINKWEKISWIILAAGILCNFGAFLMTNYALGLGYTEGNGTTAILYSISPLAVFITCIGAWMILVYTQHKFLKQKHNKWLIPIAALILFGLDLSNNILVVFFDIHALAGLQYFLVWNQFLLK
jgi:hypothetical protein